MSDQGRWVDGDLVEVGNTASPFSSFDFVERHFGDYPPIRRLFSQARGLEMKAVLLENIPAVGLVALENEEISRLYSDYSMGGLRRMSFWSIEIEDVSDLIKASPDALLGYAILKEDKVPSLGKQEWHVFEAVTRKNEFRHIYIPSGKQFEVRIQGTPFSIPGVLYCQQNGLNKACAQVALRSLCALHVPDSEVSFQAINNAAASATGPFDPNQGLDVTQMRAVLESFGIRYTDIDYTALSDEEQRALTYQKFLYAGIESGAGALLGFKLTGPEASGRHIIPFFGHTFNRDTWVPNADSAYFHVGEDTKYIPSESWLASFVGHDDNFGSNYCVPRLYITPEQAQYVVSLYRKNVHYSGVEAEAIAVNFLYSMRKHIIPSGPAWLRRMVHYIDTQQVVLRAIALTKPEYVTHLRCLQDWSGNREHELVCEQIDQFLPESLWMVELSVPELFPANLRKVGEILLNAGTAPEPDQDVAAYIFARLPERYFVFSGTADDGTPKFAIGPSGLVAHTPLFSEACRGA